MKSNWAIHNLGIAILAVGLAASANAADNDVAISVGFVPAQPAATLNIPAARARMAPELALQVYQNEVAIQASDLVETDDTTTITADLPDAAKRGQFTLKRLYSAPRSIAFKAVSFAGDGFVKSNVITRLLQAEADHVKKDQPADTAITKANYKFSYKGTEDVNGRLTHVFQVKPRQKRAGLFKGKVYIDVYTAAMVRAEGRVVKSPSLFIKKIEFTQDYAQIGDFNLISHVHSVADTRLIGRAIVDITHNDYQVRSTAQQLQATTVKTGTVVPAAFHPTRGF